MAFWSILVAKLVFTSSGKSDGKMSNVDAAEVTYSLYRGKMAPPSAADLILLCASMPLKQERSQTQQQQSIYGRNLGKGFGQYQLILTFGS